MGMRRSGIVDLTLLALLGYVALKQFMIPHLTAPRVGAYIEREMPSVIAELEQELGRPFEHPVRIEYRDDPRISATAHVWQLILGVEVLATYTPETRTIHFPLVRKHLGGVDLLDRMVSNRGKGYDARRVLRHELAHHWTYEAAERLGVPDWKAQCSAPDPDAVHQCFAGKVVDEGIGTRLADPRAERIRETGEPGENTTALDERLVASEATLSTYLRNMGVGVLAPYELGDAILGPLIDEYGGRAIEYTLCHPLPVLVRDLPAYRETARVHLARGWTGERDGRDVE